QGNIIATEEALTEAARIMQESDLPMIDRVMAAMEQADALGGDARCTCETEPLPGAQCTGKTAHVAYILAADPEDPQGRFHVNHPDDMRAPYNNGDYYLYLAVWPANTQPHEDANPVRTLRMRYDAWKAAQATADNGGRGRDRAPHGVGCGARPTPDPGLGGRLQGRPALTIASRASPS